MCRVSSETAQRFPSIDVFFVEGGGPTAPEKPGIHRTHLIKSNGVNLLCCNDEGQIYLVRLGEVKRVSAVNCEQFVCRFDEESCGIRAQHIKTGEITLTGPVRGRPDPNINLTDIAAELGIDLAELKTRSELVTPNVPNAKVLTTEVLERGPTELTYEQLIQPEEGEEPIMSLDEIEVPDLSDFEIVDVEEANELDPPAGETGEDGRVPEE